jgi:hypothetical protein
MSQPRIFSPGLELACNPDTSNSGAKSKPVRFLRSAFQSSKDCSAPQLNNGSFFRALSRRILGVASGPESLSAGVVCCAWIVAGMATVNNAAMTKATRFGRRFCIAEFALPIAINPEERR